MEHHGTAGNSARILQRNTISSKQCSEQASNPSRLLSASKTINLEAQYWGWESNSTSFSQAAHGEILVMTLNSLVGILTGPFTLVL